MSRQVDLSKGALANETSKMVVADGLEVLVAKLVEQLLVGAGQLGLALMVSACLLHYSLCFLRLFWSFGCFLLPTFTSFSASSSSSPSAPAPTAGVSTGQSVGLLVRQGCAAASRMTCSQREQPASGRVNWRATKWNDRSKSSAQLFGITDGWAHRLGGGMEPRSSIQGAGGIEWVFY